jgi:nucleoid-associated protein YgaU
MPGAESKLTITRGVYRGNLASFGGASGLETLTVDFNPTEYAQNASNAYAEAAIPGLQAPMIQFGHGEAQTLSLELLLDTHTYGGDADIRETHLRKLESFLAVDGEMHAPPPCRVVWSSLVFVGVLVDLQRRFVLFLANGRPVRVRVQLSFKEYVPVEIQVQGTPRASPDKRKTWRVRDGDRLDQIAFDVFGDPAYWRVIATANNIDNPLQIEAGRLLCIPALPVGAPRP